MIQTFDAIRYVTPLREGGSLPAIVEANNGELYVMKFSGAGQGKKVLIAELLAGEIGRALGLPVPEIVFLELNPVLGRSEPDPEIQDILKGSAGLNFGIRYLPQAIAFNPILAPPPDAKLASQIVWFDAYMTNVDRTAHNVNMLILEKELWLIDHGSCLYFHHNWAGYLARSRSPFPLIKEHVLLPLAGDLSETDSILRPRITSTLIRKIVNLIPDAWLEGEKAFATHADHREAYVSYLLNRLEASSIWVEEAGRVRTEII